MENNSQNIACVCIVFLESLVGLFMNLFSIIVISSRNVKHRDVNGNDKIIVALSISNVGYVCVALAYILIFQFWTWFFGSDNTITAVFVSLMFLVYSSSWLTASLCFYYYIKINHFSSDFLSRLQVKIGSLVSWMVFISITLSLFSSLLNILQFTVHREPSQSPSTAQSTNASWSYSSSARMFRENLYISYVSSLVPFLISVVAVASTAWSLNQHRLKVRRKQTSSSSKESMDTYKGIIRVMIYLLLFFAGFYVTLFLFFFNTFVADGVSLWIFFIILCSYSPVQSILLSLATMKLKKAWMKIFLCNAESGEEYE